MAGDPHLVDTNALLRADNPASLQHAVVANAIATLAAAGSDLYVTPQNLVEFWNVATRPAANNGLGLTVAAADARLALIEGQFTLLPDRADVYPAWRRLVVSAGVAGAKVHDARLVAFMQAYGVARILTFNGADFARYGSLGILAVDPATV